jgi:preprotein translocase subunit SecG
MIMAVFPLLAVGILWKFVAFLFVVVSLLLVLVILIQKGRGGGLSGAFGGGMAGGLLGSKTGDFLTWVTIGLVGVFLLLAILMQKYYRPEVSNYGDEPKAPRQTAPADTTAASPTGEANAPAATTPAPNSVGSTAPAAAPGANGASAAPAPTTPTPAVPPADANKPAKP